MAIKMTIPMWTLATENEQSVGTGKTVTATGNSREYPELAAFDRAVFILDVTAAAGTTPTLDVTIEGFNEASGKWHTVVTFPQQTAVSPASPLPANSVLKQSATIDFLRHRARWAVSGSSPSFTFTLVAIVHTTEPIAKTW